MTIASTFRWVHGLALVACLPLAAMAQTFTLKFSSPTINDIQHEYMKAFKQGVESRAGDKIKVELYPANQLGQIPRTVEGVMLGTVEITAPAVGFLTSLDPRFEVLDMPGLFQDVVHAQRVFSDPAIRARLATFGNAKGVEPLYCFMNGPMMLVSNRPVRSLADLRGQKIRVPGTAPMYSKPLERMGVSPVPMPLGEVLPALQNRTIDGSISAQVVFTSFKYYDVARVMTAMPQSFASVCGVVNKAFLKSLGPALEAIVREEARKAESVFMTRGPQEVADTRAQWEANRGTVVSLPEADAKRYLELVSQTLDELNANRPSFREDHQALLSAAAKYRP
jgi:TRAP-type C4-dicarboxylate transport system substrate-binding protein